METLLEIIQLSLNACLDIVINIIRIMCKIQNQNLYTFTPTYTRIYFWFDTPNYHQYRFPVTNLRLHTNLLKHSFYYCALFFSCFNAMRALCERVNKQHATQYLLTRQPSFCELVVVFNQERTTTKIYSVSPRRQKLLKNSTHWYYKPATSEARDSRWFLIRLFRGHKVKWLISKHLRIKSSLQQHAILVKKINNSS